VSKRIKISRPVGHVNTSKANPWAVVLDGSLWVFWTAVRKSRLHIGIHVERFQCVGTSTDGSDRRVSGADCNMVVIGPPLDSSRSNVSWCLVLNLPSSMLPVCLKKDGTFGCVLQLRRDCSVLLGPLFCQSAYYCWRIWLVLCHYVYIWV